MKALFTITPVCLLLVGVQYFFPQPEVATNIYARTGSRGSDCSGSGICTISTSGGQAPPAEGYKASMGFDVDGHPFIEFKYVDLPQETISTQFNSDAFVMQSDCPIPGNVLQAIQTENTTLTLKAGLYPMTKSNQLVRITFR